MTVPPSPYDNHAVAYFGSFVAIAVGIWVAYRILGSQHTAPATPPPTDARKENSGSTDRHSASQIDKPPSELHPPPELHPPGHSIVLETPLAHLDGAKIALYESARVGHFRLLDCSAFLDTQLLRVLEFHEFQPKLLRYGAISYPWRDLQLAEGSLPPLGSFSVHGAEHADPITVGVLRTACLAARQFGASLLWLDRLCIMQTSKADKTWQISQMFRVYIHADPCLVLPGGLVRLAKLDEETTWIDRAWTLQEAAANVVRDSVKCLYAFPYESFSDFAQSIPNIARYPEAFQQRLLHSARDSVFKQHVIEPGYSASCNLLDLFSELKGLQEALEFYDSEMGKDYRNLPIRILSVPSVTLLDNAVVTNRIINYQYMWMSAFVRTSSRPVDMIFSLMGLLYVQLPVGEFGENDRARAMIKLIQATLEQGKPATWLFAAPTLPPSREFSILPTFPETSESGRAVIQTPQGPVYAFEAITLQEPWDSDTAPHGSMSDDGYFTFRARGAPMATPSTSALSTCSATASAVWAIQIGRKKQFNRDPETGKISVWDPEKPFPVVVELSLMFVEKHGDEEGRGELFHRVGMENLVDESKTAGWGWVERDFCVGGPGRGDRVRFSVAEAGPVYA